MLYKFKLNLNSYCMLYVLCCCQLVIICCNLHSPYGFLVLQSSYYHNNCILNDINSKHCDCVNEGVINLLSLNVGGLIRRSQYPDFIELMNKYEILCFVETKTDDADKINIPGFDVIMTH